MNARTEPKLDERQAQQFLADLERLLPAFVPGWMPAEGKAGRALLQIYARYLEILGERLNQVPDKNKLAFLDQLGINLIPAQAARTPLVFTPLPTIRDGRVPGGTRAGAKLKDAPDPLMFETESDIALAQAKLAEVVSVWPGRDAYASHSAQVIGRQPFSLFEPLQPVAHTLYLMHNTHFALSGQSTVEIDFELNSPSPRPLSIVWEYWDGQVWRGFKDFSVKDQAGQSFDATLGLQRSGKVRLCTDCAETKTTKVNGVEGYWIRGRLTEPFPPQPGSDAPQVDRVQIQTVIDHSLPGGPCGPGLLPDAAFADAQKLDLTKTFQPLGSNPQPGNVFYAACEEAFAKPGAQVTVCFQRGKSASEEADTKGSGFEVDVTKAKKLLADAISAATAAQSQLDGIVSNHWLDPPADPFNQDPKTWYTNTKQKVQNALDQIMTVWKEMILNVVVLQAINPVDVGPLHIIGEIAIINQLSAAANDLTPDIGNGFNDVVHKMNDLAGAMAGFPVTAPAVIVTGGILLGSATQFFNTFTSPQIFLRGDVPDFFTMNDPKAWWEDLKAKIASAAAAVNGARAKVADTLTALNALNNMGPIAAGGLTVPSLTLPTLSWEFWNGNSWQPLLAQRASDPNHLPGPNDGYNFLGDGTVAFNAPESWEVKDVNSQKMHWMRVRVASGYFSRMRLVSWTDKDNNINFVPIIEPRPPALEDFYIGYLYRSPKDAPQACLSYNDFQWNDHTPNVNWRGSTFAPYQPVMDFTPTLYLGFDKPLPADLVSLYLNIAEVAGRLEGPALKWEFWDGAAWLAVTVADETHGLALPGMLGVTWPGTAPLPSATVVLSSGTQVSLVDSRQAAQFLPGELLYLSKGENGELATLTAQNGSTLTVKVPLGGVYTGGSVAIASLPRFGTPRTWLRGRLESDGEPLKPQINSIDLNAVWAAQLQTVRDELVGSSTAQPRQVHFTRQSPVLAGQEIEVRELDGARAAVELPILKRDLARQGLGDADLRTETDKSSGKIKAVWVRWQPQPHLLFSGPEDRHYVVERSQGRILFGDGQHGKIPPAGTNNLRAKVYRTGGGVSGNVPAGSVSQLLSGVLAQSVSNPVAAGAGADWEVLDSVRLRGPQVIRHRWQAVAPQDYEWLARQASPAVAVARALADTTPDGRSAKGWVKLIIIPQSQEAQPQPSFELRRQVLAYLTARVPATAAGQIYVTGPVYQPVGIEAVMAARDARQAGPVLESVRQTLAAFLHPLTGGPDGSGWPFGRDVYLSDVAAILEGLPGVDYIQTLALVLEGTPQGESAAIPPDRITAAGMLRLSLAGNGR